jgi:hypothetical protein
MKLLGHGGGMQNPTVADWLEIARLIGERLTQSMKLTLCSQCMTAADCRSGRSSAHCARSSFGTD